MNQVIVNRTVNIIACRYLVTMSLVVVDRVVNRHIVTMSLLSSDSRHGSDYNSM